jgi:hypothetical protein
MPYMLREPKPIRQRSEPASVQPFPYLAAAFIFTAAATSVSWFYLASIAMMLLNDGLRRPRIVFAKSLAKQQEDRPHP